MKYLSALLTQASGSLGGATASSNRGGSYFRARVAPVQPRTVAQQAVRATLAALSSQWRALGAAAIAGWNSLASSVTLHDSLGNTYKPSGAQLFVSCNANLTDANQGVIESPPASAPTLPAVGEITVVATIVGATFTLSLDSTWTELGDDNIAVISATPPLSPGISYIGKSKYRIIQAGASVGGPINIEAAYVARFGKPAVGALLAFQIKLVDPVTGFAGIPATASKIVTA